MTEIYCLRSGDHKAGLTVSATCFLMRAAMANLFDESLLVSGGLLLSFGITGLVDTLP